MSFLDPRPGQRFLDATAGAGGHAGEIAKKLEPGGILYALDADENMIRMARENLKRENIDWTRGNFRDAFRLLGEKSALPLDGVLADLGWASDQFADSERGFSFSEDGPLDMRMDKTSESATAADLLEELSEDELCRILREYGEERHARRIARAIVERRRAQPLRRTSELATLVVANTPPGKTRIHRATRTFQALRIAVNDELGALEEFLGQLDGLLAPGGRVVIISFHSLEDRLVKNAFKDGAREGVCEILTKKPVTASDTEVARNPRARSAKLRAARKA